MGGHDTVVGEGGVDVAAGKLAGHERHVARRSAHDDADIGLVGAHVGERMDAQQHVGQG